MTQRDLFSMASYYVLDKAGNPKRVKDFADVNRAREAQKVVGSWLSTDGTVRVSTVFLFIDHNFTGVGEPLLFETMVFVHDPDQGDSATRGLFDGANEYQVRYATRDAAVRGHARTVAAVRAMIGDLGAQVKDAALSAYALDGEDGLLAFAAQFEHEP